jgi:hypothetical protein
MQQRRNASVSVAAILPSQFNDVSRQSRFIVSSLWDQTLCCAMLPDHTASKPFGHTKRLNNMFDAIPAACRA